MEQAIIAAAETYAELAGMETAEVLREIQDGNDVILRSVLFLLEGIA